MSQIGSDSGVFLESTSDDSAEPKLEIVEHVVGGDNAEGGDDDDDEAMEGEDDVGDDVSKRMLRVKRLDLLKPYRRSLSCDDSNASEAIESLLLLGQRPVLSPQNSELSPLNRRYSSSSDAVDGRPSEAPVVLCRPLAKTVNSPPSTNGNGVVSYYQRMRERNNEASKRCRLRRRLKAECVLNHAKVLTETNKHLKRRILRLERLGDVLKEGTRCLQGRGSSCKCHDVVAEIKKVNRYFQTNVAQDGADLEISNADLVERSKQCRLQNTNSQVTTGDVHKGGPLPSSEDEMKVAENIMPRVVFPRSEVSKPKTALDVINDTIVRSLSNPSPPIVLTGKARSKTTAPVDFVGNNGNNGNLGISPVLVSPAPVLPLAKPTVTSPTLLTSLHPILPSKVPSFTIKPTSPMIPTTSSAPEISSSETATAEEQPSVVIKCEPEIHLLECEPNIVEEKSGPAEECIATRHGYVSDCDVGRLNVNKLNAFIDLKTGNVSRTSSDNVATEKAIIRSRLGIQFFKAEETPVFICGKHRYELLHAYNDNNKCAICFKNRVKKVPCGIMTTINYRMSLEYEMTTGKILPIGGEVCTLCVEKHLKGLMTASLRPEEKSAKPASIATSEKPVEKALSGGVTISTLKAVSHSETDDPQAIQQTVKAPAATVQILRVPSATSPALPNGPLSDASPSEGNIFAKICRLNEALRAINPRYKPLGFSITSIGSCSQSVLDDAIHATETAVSTIMSVIAPGQEVFLWESIKPRLESKYMDGARGGSGNSDIRTLSNDGMDNDVETRIPADQKSSSPNPLAEPMQ